MNTPSLSFEELKRHQDFVYRCIMNNVYLKSLAKFGRDLNINVQEICNSNVATLRQIGTQIEKVVKDSDSSSFSVEGPLRICGIDADKWLDFLKLTLRLKQSEEKIADDKRKLQDLENELEKFKTPGEKRSEIEAAIASLKGTPVLEASAV